ncbi:MAG: diaminopropionate ammonia-lyase [Desulfobacterota bacterium]|nr:diaminopropionate ammonia-lyase [Thermodesulfobacteriota bacterium]
MPFKRNRAGLTMKEIREYAFKYLVRTPKGGSLPVDFSEEVARRVERFHQQLPGYRPTDLVRWSHLAEAWGVKGVFIKDESTRFNLKAFKVLGGSYAVARLMCRKLGMSPDDIDFAYLAGDEARERIGRITFTTATDGNHGRGIAWTAEQLHQNAVIYMPKGAARSRVENIRTHGATVILTDLNYDDAVRLSCRMAKENGWTVIQDTAWEGYTEIPLWIMQGYMTMCVEAADQMALTGLRPTHVFVQVGVGALAGAVVGCLLNKFSNPPPRFITMEPNNAACVFASASAADGRPHAVTGDLNTIMAGLACGEPNPMAWEILRDFCCCYVACDDFVAANGVRILANPLKGDARVEAGESGAVGLGVLDLLCNNDKFGGLKQELAIDSDSTLLFFNTEGATDPESYREIVWHGRYTF